MHPDSREEKHALSSSKHRGQKEQGRGWGGNLPPSTAQGRDCALQEPADPSSAPAPQEGNLLSPPGKEHPTGGKQLPRLPVRKTPQTPAQGSRASSAGVATTGKGWLGRAREPRECWGCSGWRAFRSTPQNTAHHHITPNTHITTQGAMGTALHGTVRTNPSAGGASGRQPPSWPAPAWRGRSWWQLAGSAPHPEHPPGSPLW